MKPRVTLDWSNWTFGVWWIKIEGVFGIEIGPLGILYGGDKTSDK